jgi:hypothetical protein
MIGTPETRGAVLVALLSAAMLAVAIHALGAAGERTRQIARRHADWTALRERAARLEADRARLAEMTRAGGSPPIAEWLRAQRTDWTVEIKDLERERIDGDWALQRIQVTIARARLADLADAMDALARAPAPWRAVEINLTALETTPGIARAVLVLEGLARTPAGSP